MKFSDMIKLLGKFMEVEYSVEDDAILLTLNGVVEIYIDGTVGRDALKSNFTTSWETVDIKGGLEMFGGVTIPRQIIRNYLPGTANKVFRRIMKDYYPIIKGV